MRFMFMFVFKMKITFSGVVVMYSNEDKRMNITLYTEHTFQLPFLARKYPNLPNRSLWWPQVNVLDFIFVFCCCCCCNAICSFRKCLDEPETRERDKERPERDRTKSHCEFPLKNISSDKLLSFFTPWQCAVYFSTFIEICLHILIAQCLLTNCFQFDDVWEFSMVIEYARLGPSTTVISTIIAMHKFDVQITIDLKFSIWLIIYQNIYCKHWEKKMSLFWFFKNKNSLSFKFWFCFFLFHSQLSWNPVWTQLEKEKWKTH